MQNRITRALLSFRRVLDLLDTLAAVAFLKDAPARRQLDEAVMQLELFAGQQGSSKDALKGQGKLQLKLESALLKEHMQPIADFARSQLGGTPEFAELTRTVTGLTGERLVNAAKDMATNAAKHQDAFVRHGFPADTVAQLTAATDALAAVVRTADKLRVTRSTATEGVDVQWRLGKEAVGTLNAAMKKQFATDSTTLAAWRAAKRVTIKPVRPDAATPAPVTTPAATPGDGSKAA